jgi:phosphate starvation-inducible PhoH-like protein
MAEYQVSVGELDVMSNLLGSFDENSKLIEKEFDVTLVAREDKLKIGGEAENAFLASKVVENLAKLAQKGEKITTQTVRYCITMVKEGSGEDVVRAIGDCICVTSRGKPIKAKTLGQKNYVEAIKKNTIVLGVGPAGTGKTYLAVAMAVSAFQRKEISRIILTRPAVEAGESLGFLPGDLQSKVDPYLRPLYDAMFDMFGGETYQKHLEKGSIEVAPLAYMRGRTLDDSFIILDEAQNTTPEQMKMFLTRLGSNSKAIITGDVTQIDLPRGKRSGLKEAMRVLRDIDDIKICTFTEKDVVRHELVQKIIKAYEKYEEAQAKKRTT